MISTRILGRRAAPFPPFRITNRVPHGFTQDPIIVLIARGLGTGYGPRAPPGAEARGECLPPHHARHAGGVHHGPAELQEEPGAPLAPRACWPFRPRLVPVVCAFPPPVRSPALREAFRVHARVPPEVLSRIHPETAPFDF